MKFKAHEPLKGEWRWTLYDDSGEIVCASPIAYKSKFECLSAINRVKSANNAIVQGL